MLTPSYAAEFAGTLMKVLSVSPPDLGAIAAQLNTTPLHPEVGGSWTPELIESELARIAAAPTKPEFDYAGLVTGLGPNNAPAEPRRSIADRQDRLIRFGLRNQWYVVATSDEVSDKPVGLMRLGEKIVLWRDSRGLIHAVEDRCPHRGVKLSIGEVRDDNVRCAYHGVEVDQHGAIVKVPGLPNCGLEGRKLLRHYPTVEHYGAIWAYFGEEVEPAPLTLPYELTSPEWSSEIHHDVWPGNYHYIYDNLLDPMHGIVLHGQTYTQSNGPSTDKVRVKETDYGFEVFREGQRGVNLDWMEFIDGGSSYYFRVEIPLPPTAGPGGPMNISFFVTPVDDNSTRITVFRSRQVSGWQRDLWHLLYRNRLCGLFNNVLQQDFVVVDAMPVWPPAENLYQHDIGLVRMRRQVEKAAKEQAAAGLGDF